MEKCTSVNNNNNNNWIYFESNVSEIQNATRNAFWKLESRCKKKPELFVLFFTFQK